MQICRNCKSLGDRAKGRQKRDEGIMRRNEETPRICQKILAKDWKYWMTRRWSRKVRKVTKFTCKCYNKMMWYIERSILRSKLPSPYLIEFVELWLLTVHNDGHLLYMFGRCRHDGFICWRSRDKNWNKEQNWLELTRAAKYSCWCNEDNQKFHCIIM